MDSFSRLHELIKEGNMGEVKTFLADQNIQEVDYFFNEDNESAASTAVRSKKFEIYEFLLSHGVCFGPEESMEKLVDGFQHSEKIKLRNIHEKFSKDSSPKHVRKLISKSKLGFDTLKSNRQDYRYYIIKAFELLSKIEMIEPILKVASTSKELQIVFDFNRQTIENLDPMSRCTTAGVTIFKQNLILVGAKTLLSKKEHEFARTLGTIAHELCHFAMMLIYKNYGKPYREGDIQTYKEFQVILEETEKIERKHVSLMKNVFENPLLKVHHEELIACVPTLIVYYICRINGISYATKMYSKLFDFYKKIILPDLMQAYPLLEAKNEIKNVNLMNNSLAGYGSSNIEMTAEGMEINLGESDEIVFVVSNNPQLTLNAIYQKFKKDFHFESSFIFANLETLRNVTILDLTLKALKLSIKLNLIIDCRGQENVDQIISMIRKEGNKQKIVFVSNNNRGLSTDTCINVKHTWDHLTTECQKKMLLKNMKFQGVELPLGELMEIELIPSDYLFHA